MGIEPKSILCHAEMLGWQDKVGAVAAQALRLGRHVPCLNTFSRHGPRTRNRSPNPSGLWLLTSHETFCPSDILSWLIKSCFIESLWAYCCGAPALRTARDVRHRTKPAPMILFIESLSPLDLCMHADASNIRRPSDEVDPAKFHLQIR